MKITLDVNRQLYRGAGTMVVLILLLVNSANLYAKPITVVPGTMTENECRLISKDINHPDISYDVKTGNWLCCAETKKHVTCKQISDRKTPPTRPGVRKYVPRQQVSPQTNKSGAKQVKPGTFKRLKRN